MRKISLVIFDMHDVLCRYDRTARLDELARISGRPAGKIYADIWESGFEGRADAGQLDAAAYLQGFGERLGVPISERQWLENRKRAMTPMPEVLALLPRVQARLAVLTNNHVLVREHLAYLFPELYRICGEHSYVSAQFGAAKPDSSVYLACVAAAGGVPEESLFIDDSPANVAGAEQAGLAGHVYTDAPALAAALQNYGVL